ncbi:MAG: cell division protein FtsA [Bacteroidia bacterium]|nr:cell division protein FtsA [Bacteroidia bacterium]MCX7652657.1 cell division protein FtsA [Bacteroidia bacterium]MDW8416989.1 cell division protein FtsA [Bacteroidia bacterium]
MKVMQDIFGVVDIGTQQVRVAIGQPDPKGGVSVLGIGIANSDGIDENGVANIDRMVASIQEAFQRAIHQSGTAISRVWVVVHHIHMQGDTTEAIITFPNPDHEINVADLERLRQQAVRRPSPPNMELLHVIPQYYSIDHRSQVQDPLGMAGIRLEGHFYLVYAPQTHLNMLRKCFQRLQIEVEGFVARPIVTAEVLLPKEYKSSGCALIYMGTHSTSLVVYERGILRHFAVLPIGGHQVSADIREMLRYVLPHHAEKIKVEVGVAFAAHVEEGKVLRLRLSKEMEPVDIPYRLLAKVIQTRLEETMVFIGQEIDKLNLLGKLYGGIHLAGGGALMKDIDSLVEYVLGERVYVLKPHSILGRGIIDKVDNPRFAGVIAALYLVPMMREFIPPVPETTNTPSKKSKQSKSPPRFIQKVRSLLENSLRLPQDLIE